MKQISPGGEANITVKVSTKGYAGRKITETVSIITNDQKQQQLYVTVTGFVEKFAEITPPRAFLNGYAGKPITTQVKIVPKPQFPFNIVMNRVKDGKDIRFRVEEIKEAGNIVYVLHIENIKQEPGRYMDIIYLDTDQKNFPTLQIYVNGNIMSNLPSVENKPQ